MGTTDTALQSGSGQFGHVLVIEGYNRLICDDADADGSGHSKVLAAYSGTGWSNALPGLTVVGSIKQSIEPFKEDLDIPTMTFQIMDPDGGDVFGEDVWNSKPSFSSRLTSVFMPAADGSGTIAVKDNAAFAGGGFYYLGTRRVEVDSTSGSTDLIVAAGGANKLSPFTADGSNTYSRPQGLAEGQNWDVAAPPRISDVPATWIGKKVALYVHRIVGGVWDTRAQAHLEFAGTIAKIEDGEGITILTCHDLRKQIEDAVLLKNQWVGYIKPGIQLRTGDRIKVSVHPQSGSAWYDSSTTFTVVASGASGADECNAGLYEYSAFLEKLTAWMASDAIAATSTWAFYRPQREQGVRTVVRAEFTTTVTRSIHFLSNSPHVMAFMGFSNYEGDDDDWLRVGSPNKYDDKLFITSIDSPFRVRAMQPARESGAAVVNLADVVGLTVELESSEGSWFDHSDYLPTGIEGIQEGQNWSYVLIGDKQLAVAEYSTATKLINVFPLAGFGSIYGNYDEFIAPGLTFDDQSERLEIRQIVFLTGKFSEIVPRLFASVGGTAGVNHPDYDVFPWGAGIPWSLLGDTFVNSCASLETAESTDVISVRLSKPTRLKDVLIPEMALRFAFLVFKDGGYRFVSPPVPNSATADHTLNENNKAVGPGEQVPMTSSEWTTEHLVNVIKIHRLADATGNFVGRPIVIKDQVSIDMHGESRAWEIDAVNSVDEKSSISGTTVENLAGNITARILPTFGKPVKILRRTIAPSLYHVAPGDTVSLSDDMVRNPTTGERGIASRACVVLSSTHDYGHEGGRLMGEVTLLMSDEDRTYPLAEAGEVDTTYTSGLYTNGYDSTNFRLKLKDHAFSKSSESKDVASFVNAGLVRVLELDPANPASPDAWNRTLHASAGVDTTTGYLQMTAALSSPSWGGATKRYVVIPQQYASVIASQKLKAYQADDADGMIQDVAEPNGYGTQNQLIFSRTTGTDVPVLLAEESYGDGRPLTPYQLYYLGKGVNNLTSYKTATHRPELLYDLATTTSPDYELLLVFPFYVGGLQAGGRNRYISVAPRFRSSAGDRVFVKVVSSRFPPSGTTLVGPSYSGAVRSVAFSTTDTTYVATSALNLLPVPAQMPGHTWLSVLCKAEPGSECKLQGFPTLYLKAIA